MFLKIVLFIFFLPVFWAQKYFSVARSGSKIVQKILNSYFVAHSGAKQILLLFVALLKNKSN